MTWQTIRERSRQTLDKSRALFAAVRARLTWRRIVGWSVALATLALGTATIEALIRAKLAPSGARLPTALYTRPVAWGAEHDDEDESAARPVMIDVLGDGPQEARVPLPLRVIPKQTIDAVLAVEDQRFMSHHGVDIRRIGGAFFANVRAGGIAEGGSTITQQLAKNLFLTATRSPIRKLREATMALVLEARYDKSAILEAYLNEVYLGQDGPRAIHGIGAASRFYFGKDARKLTIAESALLAGMIASPNRLAPARHPDEARDRRNLVLDLMTEQHRITEAQRNRAKSNGVPARVYPSAGLDARYFRDVVRGSAPKGLPERGGAVFTTLDADLQRAAERAVRNGLASIRAPGAEAALVALDPRTGEVLALVGGRDYGASQFNRAVDAHRQPGSAFKPIVALAALGRRDDGPAFTLASVVQDEPIVVNTPNGPWEPADYDGSWRGPVTVREAMEQSLNLPFARMGLEIGPQKIVTVAKQLGITSKLAAVPSLALGSSEVTLLEMVRAYGVLAAGGRLAALRTVVAVSPKGDTVRMLPSPEPMQAADPAVSYLVTSALEGVVHRGTGAGLMEHGFDGAIAAKTGTSNNWRDAWFIAYTPSLVVGVWVGYDDGRSLRLTGAGAALPIVARFLDETPSEAHQSEFEVPEGIVEANVTMHAASWPEEMCNGEREVFLAGTAPASEDCEAMEMPEMSDHHRSIDWSRELKRGALQFLQNLLRERTAERRLRR